MNERPKQQMKIEKSEEQEVLVLKEHVPALITWINNKYSAQASRIYREKFGIGISDWRIIAYLGVHETGTSAQMTDFLGMDKGAISRSVSTLMEKRLLEEKSRNGRSIELQLSPSGKEIYAKILKIALQRERDLLSVLTDDERILFLYILNKVHSRFENITE